MGFHRCWLTCLRSVGTSEAFWMEPGFVSFCWRLVRTALFVCLSLSCVFFVEKKNLVDGRRCDLVVVALETGGRWGEEACNFIEEFAFARAREAPPALRFATAIGWQRRWTRMLATSSSVAFAQSIMQAPGAESFAAVDGTAPPLEDLLAADR